jgi:agmatinase
MGMRGPRNDKVQLETALAHGCTVLTAFDIKLKGIDAAVERAIQVAHAGTNAVYVTLCSDILDVAFNPGGPPDLCGLSSFEVAFILHKLAAAGIAGFDFVEIYPPQDPNRISSHAAVWMTLYVLSGLARHRFDLKPRSIP